jgi:hypothetical protein
MSTFAQKGNFKILKWMFTLGCPITPPAICGAITGKIPVEKKIEILNWMLENPHTPPTEAYTWAAATGDVTIFTWISEHVPRGPSVALAATAAAEAGSAEILKILLGKFNSPIPPIDAAIRSGNLEVFKMILESGDLIPEYLMFRYAGKSENFEFLKIFWDCVDKRRGARTAWDNASKVAVLAAGRAGRWGVLKWLVDVGGCQCPEKTLRKAKENGGPVMAQWAARGLEIAVSERTFRWERL